MEIFAEILLALLQVLGELFLQIIFESLAEVGIRCVREPFRKPKPFHPISAALGYIIFGSIAGGLSLLIFPRSFIGPDWLKVSNLFVTPAIAGSFMATLGLLRRRKEQELIRLDKFSYGFLFALAMATVRFLWSE
jgi:hypothetical protein